MNGRLFRTGTDTSPPWYASPSCFEQIFLVLRAKIEYQSKVCTALRRSAKIETFRGVKVFSWRTSPPESAK